MALSEWVLLENTTAATRMLDGLMVNGSRKSLMNSTLKAKLSSPMLPEASIAKAMSTGLDQQFDFGGLAREMFDIIYTQ